MILYEVVYEVNASAYALFTRMVLLWGEDSMAYHTTLDIVVCVVAARVVCGLLLL